MEKLPPPDEDDHDTKEVIIIEASFSLSALLLMQRWHEFWTEYNPHPDEFK